MDSDLEKTRVTQLLANLHSGDKEAVNILFESVYDELQKVARVHLRAYSPKDGLNSFALVHEVYLNLVDPSKIRAKNRGQFFALASRAMRNILVDLIRHGRRAKRGGNAPHEDIDNLSLANGDQTFTSLIDLDAALTKLEGIDEEAVKILECSYFVDMTLKEISEALEIPLSHVRRKLKYAKGWLFGEMGSTS